MAVKMMADDMHIWSFAHSQIDIILAPTLRQSSIRQGIS